MVDLIVAILVVMEWLSSQSYSQYVALCITKTQGNPRITLHPLHPPSRLYTKISNAPATAITLRRLFYSGTLVVTMKMYFIILVKMCQLFIFLKKGRPKTLSYDTYQWQFKTRYSNPFSSNVSWGTPVYKSIWTFKWPFLGLERTRDAKGGGIIIWMFVTSSFQFKSAINRALH